MCCCCCPPAISALFCLWCQSGCRKGTVAGALTFFPPDPPLYRFERRLPSGRLLQKGESAIEEKKSTKKSDDDNDNDELGDIASPTNTTPLEAETHGQTQEQMNSPIDNLTSQVAERRQRAKERLAIDAQDARAGVTFKLVLDSRLVVPQYDEGLLQAIKIPSVRGVYLAAALYRVPPERESPNTKIIIYSHGNATDIGAMFPMQVVLSHSLDCHVLIYDYSGYGESGGVPEEKATYRDMESVYDYVLDQVADGNASRIILYGQSVGSGPCCYLAAKNSTSGSSNNNNSNKSNNNNEAIVGGMILHSPFTSGMRVLTPSRLLACLDIFPNIDRIKKVKCPVMVIHGRLDQEVSISHGLELHKAVPEQLRRSPWWVPDRGHNDITEGPGKLAEYIRRLRAFLSSI